MYVIGRGKLDPPPPPRGKNPSPLLLIYTKPLNFAITRDRMVQNFAWALWCIQPSLPYNVHVCLPFCFR